MITTIFCDEYFPPIIIEVNKYKDGSYLNETTYREPSDGVYEDNIIGLWKVKYKKIDPLYTCNVQRNV